MTNEENEPMTQNCNTSDSGQRYWTIFHLLYGMLCRMEITDNR
jgi:hypothetical protein